MRALSFVAGLAIAGAAYSLAAPASDLCVNGHPAPRRHGITYGGLHVVQGFERDHIIPLCLGGPDTYSNMQYQTWEQALKKDHVEWHECEAYCKAEKLLNDAQRAKLLDDARRVFTEHKGEW